MTTSINCVFNISFLSTDFSKIKSIWNERSVSLETITEETSCCEITVYGVSTANFKKFIPKYVALGKFEKNSFNLKEFSENSKEETLQAIESYFSLSTSHFDRKIFDCIEASIYPNKKISPPDFSKIADGIDLILEQGGEVSLDQYEIPKDMLKFFLTRQIMIGNQVEIEIESAADLDEKLTEELEFEYLDEVEFVLLGCEEGLL